MNGTHRAHGQPDDGTEMLSASSAKANHVAEVLRAVAHPLRLRIVAILAENETHVNALADLLCVNQAIVSQQLRILRMHQLVEATRENGFARYRIIEPRLLDLINCLERC